MRFGVNPKNDEDKQLFFVYFVSSLILLLLAFLPSICLTYFWHEDGRFFEDRPGGFLVNLAHFEITLGRYTLSLLHYIFSKLPVTSFSDLSVIRISFVPLISLSTALFALWLYKHITHERISAFLLSMSIFTLPSVNTMMIGVLHSHVIITTILAQVSVIGIEKIQMKRYSFVKTCVYVCIAYFLILTTLGAYQPTAMFMFIFPMGLALFSDLSNWNTARRKTLNTTALIAVGMLLYFASQKYIFMPIALKILGNKIHSATGSYQFAMSFNFRDKFNQFVYTLVPPSTNLWNIYISKAAEYAYISILMLAAALSFFHHITSKDKKNKSVYYYMLQKTAIVLGLLALINSPQLLAKGQTPNNYHSNFVFPAALALLLFWSLKTILLRACHAKEKNISIGICATMATTGLLLASTNVHDSALNYHIEYLFLKQRIDNAYRAKGYLNCVHVIKPKYGYSYLGLPQESDFNSNSRTGEYYTYVQKILEELSHSRHIRIKDCADTDIPSQDCFDSASKDEVIVTSSNYGEPYVSCEDKLLIDMNQLLSDVLFFQKHTLSTTKTGSLIRDTKAIAPWQITVSSHFNSDIHLSESGLLTGKTIWHAESPPKFPEFVQIEFITPQTFDHLGLKRQPNNTINDGIEGRAPKNFVLQASNNQQSWTTLLSVNNDKYKSDILWHDFAFKNNEKFKYYKLLILCNGNKNILSLNQIMLW